MIELLGAPFDLCSKSAGARLGPAALRLAGIKASLESLGLEVCDAGDMAVPEHMGCGGPGIRGFEQAFQACTVLKQSVAGIYRRGSVPLVMGGDHSLTLGSFSAALEAYGNGLALLWIDAHADLNTPGTSSTGNLHGMPIAALLGRASGLSGAADEQWSKFLSELIPSEALEPKRLAYVGIRDVDPGEQAPLAALQDSFVATMASVDRFGIAAVVAGLDGWLRENRTRALYISFDVDALDPVLAPATGTAVRGGLTYRESHLLAELLCESLRANTCPYVLAGLEVMELSPIRDVDNSTAILAVEWLASLLGKSIMPEHSSIKRHIAPPSR